MELSSNTIERLYEISFKEIMDNLLKYIPNEKLDYFLEHFCKVFDMDFTSIGILRNMYLKKLSPSKLEIAVYCELANVPIKEMPIDYRTFLKHRKVWALGGKVNLQPKVVNGFLQPVIKKFVDLYSSLMYENVRFIVNLKHMKGN
jgi:hypothetical protein